MQKIEKLTPEQIAAMPRYVEKWLDHGLRAQPADRPNAEKAIRMMYADAGLAEPRIIWADSPLSGALIVHALRDGKLASVRESVRDSVWDSVGGQHDVSWLAFYDYFRAECDLADQTKALGGLWLLAQSCGWIYPYDKVCVATERPTICAVNERGLIHRETGPAILYPDGFAVYAWHGVQLPADWIEQRDTIDPATILAARNVEQRAAGISMIGMAKVLDRLDHKIIDSDPDPMRGDLIAVRLPDLPRPARYLKARCPRNGIICEGVPEHITSVKEAQAWRLGIPASKFEYPEKRT